MRRFKRLTRLCLLTLLCFQESAFSEVTLNEVLQGSISIEKLSELSTQINSSAHAHIDWHNFSIEDGEKLSFMLPNSNGCILNTVSGDNPSHLLGQLYSNGKIILINPQGIVFGKNSIVDTASFIASTLCLQGDFMKDSLWNFKGDSEAVIENYGFIKARQGDVALLGYRIMNAGVIEARDGSAILASGKHLILNPNGDQKIFIETPAEDCLEEIGIEQKGEIYARQVSLQSDGNLYALAINQEGLVNAYSFDEKSGQITINARRGQYQQSGELKAQMSDDGGEIIIHANSISIKDGSVLDVSGECNGGDIQLGGTKSAVTADFISVEKGATLNANSNTKGNGGDITLWAEKHSYLGGKATATGGELGGDGGFIELSSKQSFGYAGEVCLSAKKGNFGEFLIDPVDITISSDPTTPGQFPPYTPTESSNFNVTDLENALAASNVTLNTSGGSDGSGDVTFEAGPTWSSGTTLAVVADRNITINSDITSNASTNPDFQAINFTAGDTINVNADLRGNSGVSEDIYYISLVAPTVNIGDGTQTENIRVQVNNGKLYIEGTTAVNIISSNRTISITGEDEVRFGGTGIGQNRIGTFSAIGNGGKIVIKSNEGNIFLYGSGTIQLDSTNEGGVEFETWEWNNKQLADAGNITIDSTDGDLIIRGGPSNNDHAYISAGRGGNISITLSGDSSDIFLTNGTARNCGAAIISQVGGDIDIDIQGDINIIANEGGGTSGVNNEDFSCGIMAAYRPPNDPDDPRAAGNITISARDITMRGGDLDGDDVFNFAEISTGHLQGSGGSISANVRNLTMTGGNGVADSSFFLNTNFAGFATLNINGATATDDFSIDITSSGGGFNIIGGNGSNANAGIVTHNGGDLTITGAGTINLTGGGSTTGVARAGIGTGYLGGTGNVSVSCKDLIINGGTADAPEATPSNYGAVEQFSGTGTITINATDSVVLNGGAFTHTPAMIRTVNSSGDNHITINAGTLSVNGSNTGSLLDHDAKIYTNSGNIQVNLISSMNVKGGDGNSKAQIYTTNTTGNTISINAASSSDRPNVLIEGGGESLAEIYTTNGAIEIGTTQPVQSFTLNGGSGASAYSKIYNVSGGNITAVLNGDLELTGGSGNSDTKAQIATGTTSGTGNINITCEDLTMLGGTGTDANAEILPSSTGGNFTASIQDNLEMNVTAGATAIAQILVQDSSSSLTMNSGAISGGNILLGNTSSSAPSLIQTQGGPLSIGQLNPFNNLTLLGGSSTGASSKIITSTGGNLQINLLGDFQLTGGSGANTSAEIHAASSAGSGNLVLEGEKMDLAGGNNNSSAFIGGGASAGNNGGDVTVTLRDALNIGSSSMSADASIENKKVGGSLTITCDDAVLRGSDSSTARAFIDSTGTTLLTTTRDCILTAGTSNASKSFINQNSGSNFLTLNIGNDLILNSQANTAAEITSTCSIFATASRNITINGTADATAKFQAENTLHATATNGQISLSFGNFSNTDGETLLRAGTNVSLSNQSSITNGGSGENQTIVVDHLFSSPNIGAGGIILDSSSTLSTAGGGELKIYTARFSQNTMLGFINGSLFTGQNRVQDQQNQYLTYYPDGIYTSPYTVFYKESATNSPISTEEISVTEKQDAILNSTLINSEGFYDMSFFIHRQNGRVKPVIFIDDLNTVSEEELDEAI